MSERRYRWTSIGQVLSWYIRTQERYTSAPSTERSFSELLEYGRHVSSGRVSGAPGGGVNEGCAGREIHRVGNQDATMGDLALVEQCLPPCEDEDGQPIVEALIARGMLLLTCGGDKGDGMARCDAADLVRQRFGDGWTDRRCAKLLQRAQWETRVRLQDRGILPPGWYDRRPEPKKLGEIAREPEPKASEPEAPREYIDPLERLCGRYATLAGERGGTP